VIFSSAIQLTFLTVVLLLSTGALARTAAAPQRGQGQAAPQSARQSAPIDLTGYWVSVVTEDWRFRMLTPPKGDYASVPLNNEGRKAADGWDPTSSTSCRSCA